MNEMDNLFGDKNEVIPTILKVAKELKKELLGNYCLSTNAYLHLYENELRFERELNRLVKILEKEEAKKENID